MTQKKPFNDLNRPKNIKRLWVSLYVICGLTVIPDFFTPRHTYLGIDAFIGFYALLGFASCAVLILLSKLVGLILKVKEDYYEQ